MPNNVGLDSGGGTLGYDWARKQRQRTLAPVRGTALAVTPASEPGTVCGRALDGSVMVGGLGGIPTSPGTQGNNAGQQMPAALHTNGPTITASSLSAQTRRGGVIQSRTLTFTESDFTTIPTWIDNIIVTVRVSGDTAGQRQVFIDPRASTTGTYTTPILVTIGDTIDVGVQYADVSGQTSTTVWCQTAAADIDGAFMDSGNPGKPLHVRMSQATQNTVLTGGGIDLSSALHVNRVLDYISDVSPNVYPNSDTLSDSTLLGLTLASGGPGGATDAEYTGTGAAAGANKTLSRVCAVTMGQTYVVSEFIDPAQVTNNTGSTPNVLTEFSGSTQNADGSYSNVDGKSSATAYALASGQPFSFSVDIAKTNASLDSTVTLGNSANGYQIANQHDGNLVIYKIVSGSRSAVANTGLGKLIDDTNFQSVRVTVTPGSPNTITAECDEVSLTGTDSSLTLTTGTWPISFGVSATNTRAIRNYTINPRIAIGVNTADGLTQILQQYVALNTTTAGRYATSAWTCPTNLAPHSDDLSTWTNSGGALGTGGPGGATDWEYTGTGVAAGANFIALPSITVTPGVTYTFSGWVDPSKITAGTCAVMFFDTTLNTIYASTTIASGSSGRFAVTWLCPSNGSITQVRPLFDTTNCTVTSAQKLKFSQPMLEPANAASGYYISSQTPQVQVFAQLLSSAIVTSVQKFKISQPMLRADGISTPYLSSSLTYARPLATRISGGKPLIDFSESIHLNKTIDNVNDGSTYARVKGTELAAGTVKQLNDGTNVRTAAHVAGAIDTSSRLISSLYDASSAIALTPGNVVSVVLPSANADGSSVVTSQVTTRTILSSAITNNKVAGTSVSGTQVFPACYSTQSTNSSDNATTWATAANSGTSITAATTLTNGEVIYYNTGSTSYGYPPAANPRQTAYSIPASGSVTCVFNHVAFASGGSGVIRVNFTGTSAGAGTTSSTTSPVSGSGNVGWGGTQNPTTHVYTYTTVNTSTQTFAVTTSQGASTTYPLSLTLTGVNCPSDADGSSSLTISLKNPGGTTVATWSGVTATGTWTYSPSTADASGTYTWSVSEVSANGRVAGDVPYGSSYTASYNGTATYWVTSGASGNTYVLAADGTTQRLSTLDGNVQFTQSLPDTLAFKVYNSCSTSALSFSIGVDVTGV